MMASTSLSRCSVKACLLSASEPLGPKDRNWFTSGPHPCTIDDLGHPNVAQLGHLVHKEGPNLDQNVNPSGRGVTVPKATKYAIIGAGIHGLSTAFHLARKLKASGKGSGADILVVDKTAVAAGASGIACGVVRNN